MELQTCWKSPTTHAEQIKQFVRARTGGMIRGLQVDVFDDEIVLSGRTGTYYIKQLATHAALDALVDFRLTNDIEVC